MDRLTPFQERLVRLRLGGMQLSDLCAHTGRRYGTIRNDFSNIYKILNIHLLCELPDAWLRYELNLGRIKPSVRQVMNEEIQGGQ